MTESIDDIFRDAERVIGLYGVIYNSIRELGPRRVFSWDDYRTLKKDMTSLQALSNKYPSAEWIREQIAILQKFAKEEMRPWVYKRIYKS